MLMRSKILRKRGAHKKTVELLGYKRGWERVNEETRNPPVISRKKRSAPCSTSDKQVLERLLEPSHMRPRLRERKEEIRGRPGEKGVSGQKDRGPAGTRQRNWRTHTFFLSLSDRGKK